MFDSLDKAAKFYSLSDPNITNPELAERLGLVNRDLDHSGYPFCTFYDGGTLAAIRTKQDEFAIFFTFQFVQVKMKGLGTQIAVATHA